MKKKTLLIAASVLAALFLLFAAWVLLALRNLPDVNVLRRYRPASATEVLDRNGSLVTYFSDRKFRIWVPLASLPDRIIESVVTAEDDTFFGHKGVDYRAVWDALRRDVQAKRFAAGGSTITQQMIKNVLLSKEKTLRRKLREFVLAQRAEKVLTKRQILEIYLNEVEWGDGIYGIEAASRFYFDKHAAELTDAEASLLAGMLPNPKYYNPFKRPDKARGRQERVLFNLWQAKHLTDDAYQAALAEPLMLRDPSSKRFDLSSVGGDNRPCGLRALDDVLTPLMNGRDLSRAGLRIGTTLDKPLQDALSASCPGGNADAEETPDSVVVLRDDGEVRALACAADEVCARKFVDGLTAPHPAYDLRVLPADDVPRNAILKETVAEK